MSDVVRYEVRDGSAWITLNAPHNHNALSNALCAQLAERIAQANADDGARMIVLTGVGKTFCAGADLKGGGGGAVEGGAGGEPPFIPALRDLWHSPKPVIGRIQGNAYGGGLGLIAACDFAICVDSMRFAFTEVRLGLAPSTISVIVMRKMRLPDATRYFLSGDRFSAEEARQMGLVYRVACPPRGWTTPWPSAAGRCCSAGPPPCRRSSACCAPSPRWMWTRACALPTR